MAEIGLVLVQVMVLLQVQIRQKLRRVSVVCFF
jgi:hypothetical protein